MMTKRTNFFHWFCKLKINQWPQTKCRTQQKNILTALHGMIVLKILNIDGHHPAHKLRSFVSHKRDFLTLVTDSRNDCLQHFFHCCPQFKQCCPTRGNGDKISSLVFANADSAEFAGFAT